VAVFHFKTAQKAQKFGNKGFAVILYTETHIPVTVRSSYEFLVCSFLANLVTDLKGPEFRIFLI